MNRKYIIAAFSALFFSATLVSATDFREILKLQQHGMHNRASVLYSGLSREMLSSDPAGYALLCDAHMNMEGYKVRMEAFIKDNPHSVLVPQLMFMHAMNLFDAQDYVTAAATLSQIPASLMSAQQLDEYLFKKAYCELELGDMDRALLQFSDLERRPASDYTFPARYSIAYINYEKGNYPEALLWFEKASADVRFAEISAYYIMECRYRMKDYKFVVANAEKVYNQVIDERKPFLARVISESYLVLGDAENARKYYDQSINSVENNNTRADWFYSGSVMYAVKDYKGAIECFNKMGSRTDDMGQIANYHLGYSYIQVKNKVEALEAFKAATTSGSDPAIAEDAYFNWAKLAFDINNDSSVFQDYMKTYSDRAKDDRIYNYIAVAALHNRDYAAAIDAYGMIDELDEGMKNNYMKANYLRANQLISTGSYRLAAPCLKVAAYYSDASTKFNQMARFWLAESYYRNDQYEQAREAFTELYNESALDRQPESYLITYNIAYCYYKEGNYKSAIKWFDRYTKEKSVKYRKDAMERSADCYFALKDYKNAAQSYDRVVKDYFDANDIYPYYQAAISYGLSGNGSKRISLLSNVLNADPSSRFYSEALFELGRAYVVKEEDGKAFNCFRTLADNVKDNTYVARAYIEMGSLSRNQSKLDEALSYYKYVVEQMPVTDYYDDALAAIESVYQTKHDPQAYFTYIDSIGKGGLKTEEEKETMIFNAAEQVYFTEDYQKALTSLQSYIDRYPSGRYLYKADYYIAESYRKLGKFDQACDYYTNVIEKGDPMYAEQSMVTYSDLVFKLEDWETAYNAYSTLYNEAKQADNKLTALVGMMRSSYKWHNSSEVLKAAELVLYEGGLGAEVKREASYVKAKSLMALSRRGESLAVMETLAADVMDQYGAEAAYVLIMDCYDKGDFVAVEEKVFAFADAGSPQMYWLAKSFIVLGDAYVGMGNMKQARATYESVRDGYTPSSSTDDVMDSVRMRLVELEGSVSDE